jgi:hypothetical protein
MLVGYERRLDVYETFFHLVCLKEQAGNGVRITNPAAVAGLFSFIRVF